MEYSECFGSYLDYISDDSENEEDRIKRLSKQEDWVNLSNANLSLKLMNPYFNTQLKISRNIHWNESYYCELEV